MPSIAQDPEYANILAPHFAHGYASASYQIEGGYDQDGRGPSVWEQALEGKENGDVAVDSYNLWKEDVKLLKEYGANAYRFSISWSRVIPLGGAKDPVNEAGIAYYSNLIDALIEAGIEPYITLFHWDLPLELEKRYRGFACENEMDIVNDMLAYTKLCFERFGDRVKHWITFNEPFVYAILGLVGITKDFDIKKDLWTVGHRQILAHAYIVDQYRKSFQPEQKGRIGITLNIDWTTPIDDSAEAKHAASVAISHVLGWFADPIYLGKLDDNLVAMYGEQIPDFTPEQWKLIKGSSEFFGLNHYSTKYATGKIVESGKISGFDFVGGGVEQVTEKDGKSIGMSGHNGHPTAVPWGFRELLDHVNTRYSSPLNLPILVTENGFAIQDEGKLSLKEIIDDKQRQEYFETYLRELLEAVKDGVRIEGYTAWSLLDNLEWNQGYAPRFGVTYVDRDNGCKRYPKDSTKLLKAIWENAIKK